MVKLTCATAQSIIKNFNLADTTSNKPKSGRPTKLNDRDVCTVIRKVYNNSKISVSTQHIVNNNWQELSF